MAKFTLEIDDEDHEQTIKALKRNVVDALGLTREMETMGYMGYGECPLLVEPISKRPDAIPDGACLLEHSKAHGWTKWDNVADFEWDENAKYFFIRIRVY